jgi:cell division protein FtsZ
LNDNHIHGSKNVLLLIVSNGNEHEITMDEMGLINDYIQDEAGGDTNVIMGIGIDDSLGEDIAVTIIATGFPANQHEILTGKQPEKIVHSLEEDQPISKNIFERPFADVGNPEKPLKQKPDPQPDLFSSAAKTNAVVHDLYEEEEQVEEIVDEVEEPALEVEPEPITEEIEANESEIEAEITPEEEVVEEIALENEVEMHIEEAVVSETEAPVAEVEEEETQEYQVADSNEPVFAVEEETASIEIVEETEHHVEIEEEHEVAVSFDLSEDVEEPVLDSTEVDETEVVTAEVDEEDDMTFELDDIEGDGIYLTQTEGADNTQETTTEETEYDPFDMSIDEAMGEPVNEDMEQEEAQPITQQQEKREKVIHTLDDLRELEQKLQIKSPVQEQQSPEQQPVQATNTVEDEALQFEVKVKDVPSTDKQEQQQEDDFLNRPISAALRLKILERKKRLEEFNYTFRHSTTELLEKEPAYKRQGLDIGAEDHSGNSEVSRFSLSGDDNDTQIRTNNSFLHDNVD